MTWIYNRNVYFNRLTVSTRKPLKTTHHSESRLSSLYKTENSAKKKYQNKKEKKKEIKQTEEIIYYVIVQRSIVQLCTNKIVGNIMIFFCYFLLLLLLLFCLSHMIFLIQVFTAVESVEVGRGGGGGGRGRAELPILVQSSNANHFTWKLYTMDTISELL